MKYRGFSMKETYFWVFFLAFSLIGYSEIVMVTDMSGSFQRDKDEPNLEQEETIMQISIQINGNNIIYELNNAQAAKELYEQLPLTIKVEDYSNNEKIFYPPKKLNTANTPLADAQFGTLAYYAPWGNVVMFYDNFGTASGLYELGHVIAGGEYIRNLSGMITIEKM